MHKNFGEWYRLVALEPDGAKLAKRWAGVKAWATALRSSDEKGERVVTEPEKKKRKKKTQAQKDREARAKWLEPLRKAERIVAVDPGATTGIATWDQSEHGIFRYGSCGGDMVPIGLQCHFIAPGPETVIVLERSVFGPKMAAIKLAEYRGMALATALELEAGVVQVSPQTWQNVIFGSSRAKRDTKALSIKCARYLAGDESITDHNVADAVCIAEWARLERGKME